MRERDTRVRQLFVVVRAASGRFGTAAAAVLRKRRMVGLVADEAFHGFSMPHLLPGAFP